MVNVLQLETRDHELCDSGEGRGGEGREAQAESTTEGGALHVAATQGGSCQTTQVHLDQHGHKITTKSPQNHHTTPYQSYHSTPVCAMCVLQEAVAVGCDLPLLKRPLTDLGHPASCLGVSWKYSEWDRRASERGRKGQ